jgi:hypothetical protein
MDRIAFDALASDAIDGLHRYEPSERARLRKSVEAYMASLNTSGQVSLVEHYEGLATKKEAILRDHATTMVALGQLRKLEPDVFAAAPHVQEVIDFLGSGLDDEARKYLNMQELVTMLLNAFSNLYEQRQRTAPQTARTATLAKRGGPDR